jgi:DNA polymerase-3 subunit chi
MTEVDFHFNAPDRLHYTCRLLRKASRQGVGLAVIGPAVSLEALNTLLWTFDDTEFIPHIRVLANQPVAARLRLTTVWLADRAEDAAHLSVLVNLSAEPAEGFESFSRLIEVVSADEGEREAARRRWRHYVSRGYAIRPHEVVS